MRIHFRHSTHNIFAVTPSPFVVLRSDRQENFGL
jgi:hypothetical protein